MTGDGDLTPARTILPEPRAAGEPSGAESGEEKPRKDRRRVLVQAGTLTAGAIVAGTVVDPFALASGRVRRWGIGTTQAPPGSTWSSPSLPTTSPTSSPTITASGLPTYPLPTGTPATGNLLGQDPVWHLLRRATYGPTAATVADLRARGASAWLNTQLNPSSIDDSACDAYLAA